MIETKKQRHSWIVLLSQSWFYQLHSFQVHCTFLHLSLKKSGADGVANAHSQKKEQPPPLVSGEFLQPICKLSHLRRKCHLIKWFLATLILPATNGLML